MELPGAWRVRTTRLKTYGLQSPVIYRALTLQLLRQYMVLFGFTFPLAHLRAVLALMVFPIAAAAAEEMPQAGGTQPEDYLPDLKDILAGAVKRSPEVVVREFDHLMLEAKTLQVNAARLPQLAGNFSYGITQTATSGSNAQTRDSGFFYNFGLSQALFHWGALRNQSLSARLNLLVAEKNTAIIYREVCVTLRKAYLALIVEKARLRHLGEVLGMVRNDVDVAEAKKDMGTLTAADLEGERLRLREYTVEFNRAEAEYAANRRRFARLAGLPDFPDQRVPEEIPRPTHSDPQLTIMAATLLRDNAASTEEYEIYELRIQEAILRQKIEKTRLLPKFGANANYSLENTTNVNGNLAEQRAVTRQSVGIGGSWNIFDSFATRGARREALASRRLLEYKKTTGIEALIQNAQILERTLRIDAEQLELSDTRRALAVEAHRQISDEVKYGNLPKVDVHRAQIAIRLAEAQNLTTRAAYLGHWTEFVAIAGDDPILSNLPVRYARAKK
jgi:outer membrane protein TolC